MNRVQNPDCGGGACISATGEVRVYPLGGGANLIRCQACFQNENYYRNMRRCEAGAGAASAALWPFVPWSTAKPYPEEKPQERRDSGYAEGSGRGGESVGLAGKTDAELRAILAGGDFAAATELNRREAEAAKARTELAFGAGAEVQAAAAVVVLRKAGIIMMGEAEGKLKAKAAPKTKGPKVKGRTVRLSAWERAALVEALKFTINAQHVGADRIHFESGLELLAKLDCVTADSLKLPGIARAPNPGMAGTYIRAKDGKA